MKISNYDGYISHNQIVTGLESKEVRVSKGIRLSLPETDNSSNSYLNSLEDEWRSIFRLLQSGMGMQIRLNQDAGFSEYLGDYYEVTNERATNPWIRRHRQQQLIRYSGLQEAGQLRRKEISVFLSSSLNTAKGKTRKRYEDSLEASASSFDVVFREIEKSCKRLGGGVAALNDEALFEECFRHLNPSQVKLSAAKIAERFQPHESIHGNCLSSQMTPIAGEDAGFHYDGFHHGFLALKTLPQTSHSGMIDFLTNLPVTGFSIIANIEPLETATEVDAEESGIAKLERSMRSQRKAQVVDAVRLKRERVNRLLSGEVMPFQLQFVVHAKAQSRDDLADKLAALKGALSRMQGARYWEMMLPTTARNCFLATTPGMSFREKDFFLKVEDHTLANLVPISGGANESLKKAEAILHGSHGSLLGVSTFAGPKGNQYPLHMAVSGMTGRGKSVGLAEVLAQTAVNADTTYIFDSGMSHATFVKVFDENARTLILEPDGQESLNYLDTRGRALTASHLSDATAIVHLMVGHSADHSKNLRRSAIITKYLGRFYRHWARQWKEKTRSADASSPSGNLEDSEWRECFRLMKPDEVPRHRDFNAWLKNELEASTTPARELEHLAIVTSDWNGDGGKHGPILDGWSTIDFSGKIVHIELGKLNGANEQLRDLATFVIATLVRSEIMNSPRARKKRVIFEELGGFLELPGAKAIVRDYFERGRKYNCWCVAVIQQISNIPLDLARSVLGNCQQGLFFGQQYHQEVRALQEALCLPKESADSLLSLPAPTPEDGAPFLYWRSNGAIPLISRGFNITTPEMLYVAGSSGEHFEKAQKALAQYSSVMEGVIAEAAKQE